MSVTDGDSPSALTWVLPSWLDRCCRVLVFVVTTLATAGSLMACFVATRSLHLDTDILVGAVAWLVLFYLAVAIHEFGHYAAGKGAGMFVMMAHCGALQLLFRKRGFRWRFKKRQSKLLGSVLALPNPNLPVARQLLLMSAGGPIASLVSGLAALLVGRLVGVGPWDGFAYAFAIASLCIGIATLIPSSAYSGSDGLKLLRWLRLSETDPGLVMMRLNGLAFSGTTADQLPSDEVEQLRLMPEPGPLVQLWFVLKAMQNQGRWDEALGLAETLDARCSQLTDPMRKALAELVAQLRCELRFSAMMASRPMVGAIDQDITSELDWLAPALRPRCLAAEAACKGDLAGMEQFLARAQQQASGSLDAASRISEGWMREAIRQMVDRP